MSLNIPAPAPEQDNKENKDNDSGMSTIVWIVIGVIVFGFLSMAGYYLFKARRASPSSSSSSSSPSMQSISRSTSTVPYKPYEFKLFKPKTSLQPQKTQSSQVLTGFNGIKQQQKSRANTRMQLGMINYLKSQGKETEAANLLSRVLPSPPKK